jgi:lipopolysaccharide biosynthesis protein
MWHVDVQTQPTEHAPVVKAEFPLGHLERLRKLRGYAARQTALSHQEIMHKHVNPMLLKTLQTIILLAEGIKKVAMSLTPRALHIVHQQQMEKTLATRGTLKMEQVKAELQFFLPQEQTLETQLLARAGAAHIKQTTTQSVTTLSLAEIMQVAEI